MKPRQMDCLECGAAYTAKRAHSEFCSAKCRSAFNNRRFTRGAALYDLYMANRYERDEANKHELLKMMSRVDQGWRREDAEKRGGRRSWGDWKAFLLNNPWLGATYRGFDGTGRRKNG